MKTKLTALFSALLIALMITGISYALWDKHLTISGTVNTGTLDVKVLSVVSDDAAGHAPVSPATVPGNDPDYLKDVGWTEAYVDVVNDPTRETITIVLHDAYPCYHVAVHFTVENVGTVAVKYQSVSTTAPPYIDVDAGDSFGEQIDPYPHAPWHKDYTILIHVLQGALQGHTYTFTVDYRFVQWNEYVPPE
jgi:hypothetical protein